MAAEEKAEADSGVSLAASAAIPVTPPKTKLLGNLKKYTPTDMMEMLSVIIAYCLTYSTTSFRMEDSAFVSIKFTVQYSFFCVPQPKQTGCTGNIVTRNAPGSRANSTHAVFYG